MIYPTNRESAAENSPWRVIFAKNHSSFIKTKVVYLWLIFLCFQWERTSGVSHRFMGFADDKKTYNITFSRVHSKPHQLSNNWPPFFKVREWKPDVLRGLKSLKMMGGRAMKVEKEKIEDMENGHWHFKLTFDRICFSSGASWGTQEEVSTRTSHYLECN